jgi:hypothetical protein
MPMQRVPIAAKAASGLVCAAAAVRRPCPISSVMPGLPAGSRRSRRHARSAQAHASFNAWTSIGMEYGE